MKFHWIRTVAAIVAVTLVTACGGGDDETDTPPQQTQPGTNPGTPTQQPQPGPTAATEKYVGVWRTPCMQSRSGQSESEVLTIGKVSATQLTYDFVTTEYATTDCTGNSVAVDQPPRETAAIDGQAQRTYQGTAREFDLLSVATGGGTVTKQTSTVLPDGRLVIDFDDNEQSSSTNYPSNPNEGQTVYTKQQ